MKKLLILPLLCGVLYTDKADLRGGCDHTREYEGKPYINRLIWHESKGKTRAYSRKGAIGYMQIMPKDGALDDYNTFNTNGDKFTAKDLWNKEINKKIGFWYYERLGRYYEGDKVKQVSAYNMGFGNTDSGAINFDYVFRIMGTNKVLTWLDGRKVKPWKGTTSVYYVLE